jgi:succinylglutamate desuccinylase
MGDIKLFDTLQSIPEGFLDISARNLHKLLKKPTLIHLSGRQSPSLFVSILLHGNEDTGLKALQAVLKKYAKQTLPRGLSIFCGNIEAARMGLRRLDNQPDYNRIWPGTDEPSSAETAMAGAVVATMQRRGVFASIDIHNNTGLNPHYGCINKLDPAYLHLAALFSRTTVFFRRPLGVQSMALSELCPAITIECGKAGSLEGEAHAASLIEAVLNLSHFPMHDPAASDLDIFHTVGIVKIPESISFSFDEEDVELQFNPDIDHMNFCELSANTVLAKTKNSDATPQVISESGEDITKEYFEIVNNQLVTKKLVMPSMLTLDKRVIRQDCLCYLMERYSLKPKC